MDESCVNCPLLYARARSSFTPPRPSEISEKNFTNYGWIGCASQLVDPKGLPGFFHTFSMALYNKWDVKNDFAYVLQFFSLIFDDLGDVYVFTALVVVRQ